MRVTRTKQHFLSGSWWAGQTRTLHTRTAWAQTLVLTIKHRPQMPQLIVVQNLPDLCILGLVICTHVGKEVACIPRRSVGHGLRVLAPSPAPERIAEFEVR